MYYTQYFSQELPDHVRYLTPLAQVMGVWPRSHACNCIFIKENVFKLIAFATLNHSRAIAIYNTLGALATYNTLGALATYDLGHPCH